MPCMLGDVLPDFKAETTNGQIESFHDFCRGKWTLLFSHPSDNTPVCTSEVGTAAKLQDEFKRRGVQLVGLSCDGVESHKQWIKDIEGSLSDGKSVDFPIIADEDRRIATDLGMLDPDEKGEDGVAHAARSIFVISPDVKNKLCMSYPSSTGRNFNEILRVIDSLQLAAKYEGKIATPADWQQGEEVMIAPTVTNEEADKLFPHYRTIKVKSGKAYVRKVEIEE